MNDSSSLGNHRVNAGLCVLFSHLYFAIIRTHLSIECGAIRLDYRNRFNCTGFSQYEFKTCSQIHTTFKRTGSR